jgi:hypothetical protein
VQYLQDPGHHGVLREDIDGEKEELQKELDLVSGEEAQFDVPEGPQEIQGNRRCVQEGARERGAFALVDASDALGKSKRDASISLLSTSSQKERATISLVEAVEAE